MKAKIIPSTLGFLLKGGSDCGGGSSYCVSSLGCVIEAVLPLPGRWLVDSLGIRITTMHISQDKSHVGGLTFPTVLKSEEAGEVNRWVVFMVNCGSHVDIHGSVQEQSWGQK